MTDYSIFANPDFDANDYANAILAGEPYPPQPGKAKGAVQPAKEDISEAIAKLDNGIDDVSKQIKSLVSTHHEALLEQAASVSDLSSSLSSVRNGLSDLESSVDKLRVKIHIPYQTLRSQVTRLQKIQQASDALRRASRFVVLARRLDVQMSEMNGGIPRSSSSMSLSASTEVDRRGPEQGRALNLESDDDKERTIAKAALSIAELVALLDESSSPSKRHEGLNGTSSTSTPKDAPPEDDLDGRISLTSINAIASYIPFIEDSRTKVTSEMESMVMTGLGTLNQSLLASSLQTAYNLRILPELVQSLVVDLSDAVDERIRTTFDLSRISKEVLSKDPLPASQGLMYKSRVRTEPTNVTAPQWTAVLWGRMENVIEELSGCCFKVYTLEKVLKMKRDAVSQAVFLDEAMKLLDNRPSSTFWTALSRSLEKHIRDAAKSSTFLQQTLSNGYPKLLRLFHDFFAKISVQTDTVYSQTHQSPETVLVLRALSNFEALYLSRSSTRINEAVGQAFSGGARAPPGAAEGTNVARTVVNELDSARFDPLLVQAVAKGAVGALDIMLTRVDGLVARDRAAVTLLGPTATPQQMLNGQLASCLYHCRARLEKLEEEYPEKTSAIIKPAVGKLAQAFDRIVDPLLNAVRRDLGAIIARLHRMDFGRSTDPGAGMGGGASLYMKDLTERLSFIKAQILGTFSVGDAAQSWAISIVEHVIRTFVLHVSITKPLGESGKLQLTSDMAELEFALSAFMQDPQSKRGGNLDVVGDAYKMLRAMRPLIFLDTADLASPAHTAGLPPLVVLHHILVRSPLPLPHALHGWQEAEYVRWVDAHAAAEAWALVDGDLVHWEKVAEAEGRGGGAEAAEYVRLARAVLANARGGGAAST